MISDICQVIQQRENPGEDLYSRHERVLRSAYRDLRSSVHISVAARRRILQLHLHILIRSYDTEPSYADC